MFYRSNKDKLINPINIPDIIHDTLKTKNKFINQYIYRVLTEFPE